MIDRFEVPEPSASALAAFMNTHAKQEGGFRKYPLHAAFAEDVPRIVRAECEAMLKACGREVSTHIFVGNLDAYLSARFGPEERKCLTPGSWTGMPVELGGEQPPLCTLPHGHSGPHSWEKGERVVPNQLGVTHVFQLADGSTAYGCLLTPEAAALLVAIAEWLVAEPNGDIEAGRAEMSALLRRCRAFLAARGK